MEIKETFVTSASVFIFNVGDVYINDSLHVHSKRSFRSLSRWYSFTVRLF